MTAVLLGDYEPNSPEWHALRETGIGASEIAAVAGLSPYESAFALWHRKAGNLPAVAETEPMRWGNILEPIVAAEFAHRHDALAVTPAGTHAHGDRSWQLANVDRLLSVRDMEHAHPFSLLEIKTSRFPNGWGKSGTSEIPLHYRCQVMQQMDVFGFDHAWVAVLIGGNEYREYVIDYDPSDAAALREAGEAFWHSLQRDEEPPIDASDSTYHAVRQLHPEINDADLEIDPAIWLAYADSKAASDHFTAEHQAAKSAVLQAMGNARRALVAGTPVLRRQPAGKGGVALHPIGESA